MRKEKASLPVDVRRSKTALLKFPNVKTIQIFQRNVKELLTSSLSAFVPCTLKCYWKSRVSREKTYKGGFAPKEIVVLRQWRNDSICT